MAGTEVKGDRARTLIFSDESGLSECPPVRRTWAPRGQTPVVVTRGRSWRRMPAIGALAYDTQRRFAKVFLRMHRGNVCQEQVAAFVRHLRRGVRGEVVLIWDGLSAPRGALVRRELARGRGRIRAVRLPAYAPEINPIEAMWAWLKQQRLANVAEAGIDRIARRVMDGTRNCRRRPLLLCTFLAKAGPSL